MSSIKRFFLNDSVYHVFNRGVEKRDIFINDHDYHHFLSTLLFYQQLARPSRFSLAKFDWSERSKVARFKIIAYCLMPNHFHLMIQQLADDGVSDGLSQVQNSYCKYFNTKYQRVGPLFQGRFKSVNVLTNEQFMHLARYIFLNPYVSKLIKNPIDYRWSGLSEYLGSSKNDICEQQQLLEFFPERSDLESFISDYADYAQSLEEIKHDVLD